jgi:hypothetical protein
MYINTTDFAQTLATVHTCAISARIHSREVTFSNGISKNAQYVVEIRLAPIISRTSDATLTMDTASP